MLEFLQVATLNQVVGFVQTVLFVITFLLVLATIRKFLMVTGYERFSKPWEALRASYKNGAFYAFICVLAGTLGFIFNQVLVATCVIILASAFFYAAASVVYNAYMTGRR